MGAEAPKPKKESFLYERDLGLGVGYPKSPRASPIQPNFTSNVIGKNYLENVPPPRKAFSNKSSIFSASGYCSRSSPN
ncbi:hypothetical protein JTE90_010328 [Oedothorax gibbosus]|uniref:Uncharacterized protein n=1 Tax=Oedothorax gibbosus TaxID=931172 RepID=A0AAV6TCX3_9ARAC|nr:hypothetical protein JTE90_010328 [Oedothorax gibbosus]